MEPLSAHEARVLGVLIEKAMTTPDQYPLTLNSIVSGSSQKSNRFPVIEMSEDDAYLAVESLREQGLAVRVEQSGARVGKYKHLAAEKLNCRPAELALLAELLLRGPQTVGELRGRASRMQAFESIQAAEGFLRTLMERSPALVQRLPPAPGTRAEKYEEMLSEATEAEEVSAPAHRSVGEDASTQTVSPPSTSDSAVSALTARIETLEAETAALRAALRRLASDLGHSDPLG